MKQSKIEIPASFCILLAWHFISNLVEGHMVTFHITNKCPFPIWPAIAPNAGHPMIADGGFLLHCGRTQQVQLPATWNGRFWARTGCKCTSTSQCACETGDCRGLLSCNGAIGLPPATLVQVSLHEGMPSYYDVSLVDGFNLPISVSTRPGNSTCMIEGCKKSINTLCPRVLQVLDQSGNVVACKSACLAFNQDKFCCRNSYGGRESCGHSKYSRVFKNACPSYISYAYDTLPIKSCHAKDFFITFCPYKWSSLSSF